MTDNFTSTPYTNSANKDNYGRKPLQSWVGKVVSYESQEDQLNEGWGWRYKVRILGDHSDGGKGSEKLSFIPDEKLSYAYSLLPTTAGSGAGFKLRSVRISQGDMVFGVQGGKGPRFIIGVFPRTTQSTSTANINDKFGTLTGFYGSLKKNKTLSGANGGEFNEQIGPATPDVTPLPPKSYNKSNANDTSETLSQAGYDRNQDGVIDDAEKKLTPLRTAEVTPPKDDGSITSQQLKYMLENKNIVEVRDKIFQSELSQAENDRNYQQYMIQQINKALDQGLIENSLALSATNDIKRNRFDRASIRLFPPSPPINEG